MGLLRTLNSHKRPTQFSAVLSPESRGSSWRNLVAENAHKSLENLFWHCDKRLQRLINAHQRLSKVMYNPLAMRLGTLDLHRPSRAEPSQDNRLFNNVYSCVMPLKWDGMIAGPAYDADIIAHLLFWPRVCESLCNGEILWTAFQV